MAFFRNRRSIALLLSLSLVLCMLFSCAPEPVRHTDYFFEYFDTVTTVIGYEGDESDFDAVSVRIQQMLAEYHRLYDIYTFYDGCNNLAYINYVKGSADSPIKVDGKIIDLLLFAKQMYNKTGGKINVAMGSVLSIWHEYRMHGSDNVLGAELPPMDKLSDAVEHTNIDDVVIDEVNSTVYLRDNKMTLDVGAIAKGYAVEQIARTLAGEGVSGYTLNVGGNVRVIGGIPGEGKWEVAIENPLDGENSYLERLYISDMALVTSGTYQRFYIVNGKSYHHIIDPQTLFPSDRYTLISVLGNDSGVCDALSTALFCMDLNAGQELVESISGVEALWLLPTGERVYSSGFETHKMRR